MAGCAAAPGGVQSGVHDAPAPADERLGYLFMVASSLSFAVMGVLVKLASATLPFYEVSFFRAFGGFLLTVGAIAVLRLPATAREPRLLVLRGFYGWAALTTYFLAISGLHLADAVLLNYTSPFFTALLAALVLGERITARTVACLVAATAGVALVVGPTGGFWNWYALVALGSAFLAASAYVTIKKANAANPPWVIVAWFSAVASLLTLPFLLYRWVPPTPEGWALLAGAAVTGTLAQVLMTYGYKHARASTASVISLTTPLLAAGLGIGVLGQPPTWGTLAGGALIIAAGVALAMAPRPAPQPLPEAR